MLLNELGSLRQSPCEFFNSKSGAASPTANMDKKDFPTTDDCIFDWRKDCDATTNMAMITAKSVEFMLI